MYNEKLSTLTTKQREAYLAIEAFIAQKKIPPTVRELGEILGEKTPGAVQGLINRLAEKGVIKKELGVARSIQLVQSNSLYLRSVYVPELKRINKRNINDLFNIYNILAYHPMSVDMFGDNLEKCFILDCPDNSLAKNNIKYGDLLLISPNSELSNNDIVLVYYENHVLLRYYSSSCDENKIILRADSNLLNKEKFNKDEIIIIGKVISKIQTF